jgi:hypothetical protein
MEPDTQEERNEALTKALFAAHEALSSAERVIMDQHKALAKAREAAAQAVDEPEPGKPMKPHAVQESYVYVRARRMNGRLFVPLGARLGGGIVWESVKYNDNAPGARTISSRRVEEAVEVSDYLRLCREAGRAAENLSDGRWRVHPVGGCGRMVTAPTLREAYFRAMNGGF